MIIYTSENELNDVLDCIAPRYPKPHISSIQDQCFYVVNEVPITIRVVPNGKEHLFNDLFLKTGEGAYLKYKDNYPGKIEKEKD